MSEVLGALEMNETVTILHRGKEKGVIYPIALQKDHNTSAAEHPSFGMWKEREDFRDVARVVRNLRKGRGHAL